MSTRSTLGVLLASVCLAAQPGTQPATRRPAEPAPPLAAEVDVLGQAFPSGAAVPVRVTFTNTSNTSLPLEASTWGPPMGPGPPGRVRTMILSIVDEQGLQVKRARPPGSGHSGGSGGAVPQEEIYLLPPGRRVPFVYDVTAFAQVGQPGKYTVRFWWGGVPYASDEFDVLATAERQVLSVRGGIRFYPGALPEALEPAMANVKLLTSGQEQRVTHAFLSVEGLSLTGESRDRTPAPPSTLPVPEDAHIDAAAMDYLGRVWIVLRSGGQTSLVIWRAADRQFETLIPAQAAAITLESARAWAGLPDFQMVIGGTPDRLFTTTSVSSSR